jgi:hypothetical protein
MDPRSILTDPMIYIDGSRSMIMDLKSISTDSGSILTDIRSVKIDSVSSTWILGTPKYRYPRRSIQQHSYKASKHHQTKHRVHAKHIIQLSALAKSPTNDSTCQTTANV